MQHFCEAAMIGIRACPHLDGEICTNTHPCGSRVREDSKRYLEDQKLRVREIQDAKERAKRLGRGIDEDYMSDVDCMEIMWHMVDNTIDGRRGQDEVY